MKTVEEILEHFKISARSYSEIDRFSEKPGIYAVSFIGNAFPVLTLKPGFKEIIYIGKTESSQASRDANTHFASGKSGSSTLRRSIGALMLEGAKLNPIPRSQNPGDEKRFTHFMFDAESETRISNWMKNNLGLSFYEFIGSKNALDLLETTLIQKMVPMLNIDYKNTANSHTVFIRGKRSECVRLAQQNANYQATPKPVRTVASSTNQVFGSGQGLYFEIWNTILPNLKNSLKNNENFYVQLSKDIFDSVGNRDSYSFNLVLNDRIVQNNIGGSAVARDLYKVLSVDTEMKALLHDRQFKFRMDSKYYFSMEIL